LFDTGCGIDPGPLIANIRRQGVQELKYIFLTHAHADHACGTVAVQLALGGAVVASEADARLIEEGSDHDLGLEHARRGGSYPPDFAFTHCRVDVRAQHDATFAVGAHAIRTILVPSHTPGSLCYLVEGDGLRRLVTGDVVFVGGLIGLINVPGCELGAFREYLPRLGGLAVDAIFPGHLLWRLRDAQRHIDHAIEQTRFSRLPKTLISLKV
jgi:glyoxylase-like metal-dependent hydrolase (beta-lactamase superfamily II)